MILYSNFFLKMTICFWMCKQSLMGRVYLVTPQRHLKAVWGWKGYIDDFPFMQSITLINIIICGKNNPAWWSETALAEPFHIDDIDKWGCRLENETKGKTVNKTHYRGFFFFERVEVCRKRVGLSAEDAERWTLQSLSRTEPRSYLTTSGNNFILQDTAGAVLSVGPWGRQLWYTPIWAVSKAMFQLQSSHTGKMNNIKDKQVYLTTHNKWLCWCSAWLAIHREAALSSFSFK